MALLSLDGKKILSNYDRYTGEAFNATKTTKWFDGSPMNDSKVDNVIYFKNTAAMGGGYSKRDYQGALNVKWFGALGNGIDYDAVPIQKCVDLALKFKQDIFFPKAVYVIETCITLRNVSNINIISDSATLKGVSVAPQKGVLVLINFYDSKITGILNIITASTIHYESGLRVTTAVDAAQGDVWPYLSNRNSFFNIRVEAAQIGIKIGDKEIDRVCSENNFFGCEFYNTLVPFSISGSQTGATLIGCNIVSEDNAAYDNTYIRAGIWMQGGFVTVNGGELMIPGIVNGRLVYLNPCVSSVYKNSYPILRVNGTHVEMASKFATISNPENLVSPDSRISQMCVVGSGGYASSSALNQNLVEILDSTYEGFIQFSACNIYSQTEDRTAENIYSLSNLTNIQVDFTSFGDGFKNWMGGVIGGKLLHSNEVILSVSGISNGSIPANIPTNLKFLTVNNGGQLRRFVSSFRTSDGTFIVPGSGLKYANFKVNLFIANLNCDLYLTKNGAAFSFGQFINGTGILNVDLFNLVSGDQIAVVIRSSTSVNVPADAYNYMTVIASN